MKNFKLERVNATRSRYIIHFYCLSVEAGFYRDMVECLPVDSAGIAGGPVSVTYLFQ